MNRKVWRFVIILACLLLPVIVFADSSQQSQVPIDPLVTAAIDENGEAAFWIIMEEAANLNDAPMIADWNARGEFVIERLQETAVSSQANILAILDYQEAPYQPYWIINAIQVTGNQETLDALTTQTNIAQISATKTYYIPEPIVKNSIETVQPDSIEWNIDHSNAPQVWSTYGIHGENIVVANLDTGVQFDHPALYQQYRGYQPDGTYDHNYNWFDPSEVCSSPSLEPCDNAGHGTHTMGTMIGDAPNNQIGVAPGAQWITAKGCEGYYCSLEALLSAGQWLLAPTNLNGENPRPDLRPHVINNSWGGSPGDLFYLDIVEAWVAAGIFPVFSNGNGGSGCNSAGSPGDYALSYSVGAFDSSNVIADFSGRGSSVIDNGIKPNIAAPGVNVRSSVPNNQYDTYSGTSMAAPHIAGTVALLWSAAPALIGDLDATRALLNQTAVDVDDTSCGGTSENNNTWGEGQLDAFAAVMQSPHGPTGTLQGNVSDSANGSPIAAATVTIDGDTVRTAVTEPNGAYQITLPVGVYTATTTAFGYLPQTAVSVMINENVDTTLNFQLAQAPSYQLSGTLRDDEGFPLANTVVTIAETPLPAQTTDSNGYFIWNEVPAGSYTLIIDAEACHQNTTHAITLSENSTLDIILPLHRDAFGYYCSRVPTTYTEGDTLLSLTGDDQSESVSLPFQFPFYGVNYDTAYVSTNGSLNFLAPNTAYWNVSIPNNFAPNAAIYPFWDDLVVDNEAAIWTAMLGAAPDRQFVIEWRNVRFYGASEPRFDFEIILHEGGRILTQYRNVDADNRIRGSQATIGIENEDGSVGLEYGFRTAVIHSPEDAILYSFPPRGSMAGTITNINSGLPVSNAIITIDETGATTNSNEQGEYILQLPVGTFTASVSADNHATEIIQVEIFEDQESLYNIQLQSPFSTVIPTEVNVIVNQGEIESTTLILENSGQLPLNYTIHNVEIVSINSAANPTTVVDQNINPQTPPAEYTAYAPQQILANNPTLVFMDYYPWSSSALLSVLAANNIGYDLTGSDQMGTVDLTEYQTVFISNDQPQQFYDQYNANFSRFDAYVRSGGVLWVGAAAWGWNGGDFSGSRIPGGTEIIGPVFSEQNLVVDSTHPMMQGVPNPFGIAASLGIFSNLPQESHVIAQHPGNGQPTLVEYSLGLGRVFAFAQPMEWGWEYGDDTRLILENGVPYAYNLPSLPEADWLSYSPENGTIDAGQSENIQLTLGSEGLLPGVYRARLTILSNAPHSEFVVVPVTFVVSAHALGINVGGDLYIDAEGNSWVADQAYEPGGWGYIKSSNTFAGNHPIDGTDDDLLYQTMRIDPYAYRFDDLPAGFYQVEIHLAELYNYQPGRRLFDVIIEDTLVLPAHDIAYEVDTHTAEVQTFTVELSEDGRLDIRLISRRGYSRAILNALKITQVPPDLLANE